MTSLTPIVLGLLAALALIGLTLSRASLPVRLSASLFGFGLAAFCGFGYLASFEQSDSPLSPWHLGYAILGLGSLLLSMVGMTRAWITIRQQRENRVETTRQRGAGSAD